MVFVPQIKVSCLTPSKFVLPHSAPPPSTLIRLPTLLLKMSLLLHDKNGTFGFFILTEERGLGSKCMRGRSGYYHTDLFNDHRIQ